MRAPETDKGPRATLAAVVSLAAIAFSAVPAGAELVYLSSGRSLSVKAYRVAGDSVILSLRGGGEVVCDAALVVRVEPDEVPYPEEVRLTPDATSEEIGVNPNAAVPGRSDPNAGLMRGVPLQPWSHTSAFAEAPADRRGLDGDGGGQADLTLSRYEPIILRVAAEQGVDAKLVRAVIQVESGYQPRARSSRGAMGLMQLMPATARHYGIRNPYDPASNIEAGIKHLRSLLERFPLALALAAYNAGEAAVHRFSGIPPYPETRFYISRILKLTGR